MGYIKNEEQELFYEYDFDKDGGAVGNISLRPLVNALKEGVIIREIEVRAKTALTSGGTPTVTLGNSGDVDGYMTDMWALLQTVDTVVNSAAVGGALVWDDTNDHKIHYRVDSTANNQDLVLAVGTAALTAGKLEIMIKISSDGN